MPLIERLDVARVSLPLPTLQTSYGGGRRAKEHVFVRLAAGGIFGYGEASPLPHFTGEAPPQIAGVIEQHLAPAVIGVDVLDRAGLHRALDRALPGNTTAKAAVDMAVHDAAGRAVGVPACHLLGGRCRRTIPVVAGIGISPPEETARRAEALVAGGVGLGAVKLKVGVDVGRDVAAARAVRRALGPGVGIRLDANQGYTRAEACRLLRGVSELDIQYLEQPLPAADLGGLAWLRRLGHGVPIAVDESVHGPASALGIIRAEAADVLVIKLIKAGGVHRAAQVLVLAEAAGLTCTVVSPYETALGVAAGIHLAASSPAAAWPCELATHESSPGGGAAVDGDDAGACGGAAAGCPWPVTPRDHPQVAGGLVVPDGPGLGVVVDGTLFGAPPPA